MTDVIEKLDAMNRRYIRKSECKAALSAAAKELRGLRLTIWALHQEATNMGVTTDDVLRMLPKRVPQSWGVGKSVGKSPRKAQ